MNSKKNINKRIGTKNQFILAAKQIIMGEKLQALNIRTISETAGYTPSTFYQYFKDLDECIGECIYSFIDDLEKPIKDVISLQEESSEKEKKFFLLFARYFVQYFSIFQLLYLENVLSIKKNPEITKRLANLPISILEITDETKKRKIKIIYQTVVGLLLFYLNRFEPKDYSEFEKDLKEALDSFGL